MYRGEDVRWDLIRAFSIRSRIGGAIISLLDLLLWGREILVEALPLSILLKLTPKWIRTNVS